MISQITSSILCISVTLTALGRPLNELETQEVDIKKESSLSLKYSEIKNYKQAINQLVYNPNLDSKSLNKIKTFIVRHSKISNDLDALYYKALINIKISKYKFSFLDDSDINTIKAIQLFKKVIHSPKANHELREICKVNIQQIYNKYINRGLKYYKMGHYYRAKSNYLILKKIDPNPNNTNLFLGCLYLTQGESRKALKMYKQCTNLTHGRNAAYYYGMAELFNNAPQRTLEIVNVGLKKYPYNNDLIKKRLRILEKINDLNKYKSLISKKIPRGAKYYQMAKYYEFVGDDKHKLDFLKKAARYSKNQYETEFALAVFYYNRAAEYSKIISDEFYEKSIGDKTDDISKKKQTKKMKKKKKVRKKLSNKTKLKRCFQLSKEMFVKANVIKPNRLVTEKINFINTYLNNLKQQNKQAKPQAHR